MKRWANKHCAYGAIRTRANSINKIAILRLPCLIKSNQLLLTVCVLLFRRLSPTSFPSREVVGLPSRNNPLAANAASS